MCGSTEVRLCSPFGGNSSYINCKDLKIESTRISIQKSANEWFLLAKITEANSNNDPEIKEAESC